MQRGDARLGPDPLSLVVPVRRLPRGVYTVTWKVVSAIDGHATDGTYAFGVRASPEGDAATSSSDASSSTYELLARLLLIAGIVALLGGSVAGVARFGGGSGSDLRLAIGGWGVAVVGLLLLGDAQRRASGGSLGDLLGTAVGEALLWRALALALAGVALLLARQAPRRRRAALAPAALGALGAIVAHVDAGHAAAGGWPWLFSVGAQVAHFAAAGVWLGGLAALLLGMRGATAADRSAAVRRFSALALAMLILVFLTGTLRAFDELAAWSELWSSGYGRAILAKLALLGLIVALAARNRRRNVARAGTDPGPLRRTSAFEIGLAVGALFVAALLGTLAPPVSGSAEPAGLSASGADYATTTRVELTTASDQPGPNLFTATVEDYDSGEPLAARSVELRFTPLDDPGVGSSTLALKRAGDDAFTGSGPNLAFDGRWRVVASVALGDGGLEVPLDLEVPGPKQFVSVLRVPGEPPEYTMQIGSIGNLRIVPDPQRAGPSSVRVDSFTAFGSFSQVAQMVVAAAPAGKPLRQQPLRRLGPGTFVTTIELREGPFEIAVVARTQDGTRLRGVFEINVPG